MKLLVFLLGMMLLSYVVCIENAASIYIDPGTTTCTPQVLSVTDPLRPRDVPFSTGCPNLEAGLNFCKEGDFTACSITAMGPTILPEEKNSGLEINGEDYPALESITFLDLNSIPTVSSSFFLQIHNATFNITMRLLNVDMQYSGFPCLFIHNINPQSVIELVEIAITNVDSSSSAFVIESPGTIELYSISVTNTVTRNDCGALQLRTYDTTVLKNPFPTINQIHLSNTTTGNGGLCILGGGHLSFSSVVTYDHNVIATGRAIFIDGPGDYTFTHVVSITSNYMSENGRFLHAVNFNNLTLVDVSVTSNIAGNEIASEGGLLYIDTAHARSTANFHQLTLAGSPHGVAQKGGLIYVRNLKELKLYDTILSGGNAIVGGAILLENVSTFSAINVNLFDCYATTGSAIACYNSTNTYMSNVTTSESSLVKPENGLSIFYSDGSCASPFWTSGTTADSCTSCNSTVCSNLASTEAICYCDGYNCEQIQIVPPSTNTLSSDNSEVSQSSNISGFEVFLVTIGCISISVIIILITVAGYFVYKRKTNIPFEKVSAE